MDIQSTNFMHYAVFNRKYARKCSFYLKIKIKKDIRILTSNAFSILILFQSM